MNENTDASTVRQTWHVMGLGGSVLGGCDGWEKENDEAIPMPEEMATETCVLVRSTIFCGTISAALNCHKPRGRIFLGHCFIVKVATGLLQVLFTPLGRHDDNR